MRYLLLSIRQASGGPPQNCTTLAVGTLNKFTKLQTLLVSTVILTELSITITYTLTEFE